MQDPSRRARRVLIHGINYAPELTGVGRYTSETAEFLAGLGHDVEVVTTAPHYPGWYVRQPYRAGRYSRETLNGVRVFRCPILLHKSGSGIWRLLAPMTFAASAAPAVLWRALRRRPDTIVCLEPTLFSAPAVLIAAGLTGARSVLHVQDLEIDAAFAVGHLSGGLMKRLAFAFERFVLRRFSAVITISDRMRDRLEAKGARSDRVKVVRNWVNTEQIRPEHGPNGFRRELGLSDDDLVVLYAGQIGAKQALHLVFDAAERLEDKSRIQFVVAGEGPLREGYVRMHGARQNVHFLPLQPENRLAELLNLADVHVLPQEHGTADLVLPSKLGGMLASRGHVVISADPGTELHDILHGSVIFAPAGDSEALAAAIAGIAPTDPVPERGRARSLFAKSANLPDLVRALLN